jgi:hypothetical protein|tara:strand:- start:758 stop:982 length:225 start_codon:yes stop_codon:yes gene_type:complete
MEHQLSLHLKKFNDRVKVMNQTNGKELLLPKLEALNLHSEIFELLARIEDLTKNVETDKTDNANIEADFDGGNF